MKRGRFLTSTFALVAAGVVVIVVLVLATTHSRPNLDVRGARTAATTRGAKPTQPIAHFTADKPFFLSDGLGQYDGASNVAAIGSAQGYLTSGFWVDVPRSYDTSNRTPATLLVWMHGCDGSAFDDITSLTSRYTSDRPWITISLNGPEGGGTGPSCWNTNSASQADVTKVLVDVALIERHFNIDRRRVIIGGYSSGGNLAYQTIFQHARTFAGILAMNTHPVADNSFAYVYGEGSALKHAVAGSARRFPIVQISHSSDDLFHVNRCGYAGSPRCPTGDPSGVTSPDPGVRPALSTLHRAGYPVTFVVLAGHHYQAELPTDCDGGGRPDPCRSGTYYDIAHRLLSYITRYHWEAP